MTIFTSRKNSTGALSKNGSTSEKLTQKISKNKNHMRGNIFFALFAAVAMVGAVGYGFNTVIRGPISSMSDVTRRTVTENFVITASRVAIVNATTQQANAGDCDADGMIEPLPWRAPAGAPAPVGGGLIPLDLVPDTTDPWQTQYGYCAWDAGSLSVSDAVAGCGGATPRRLQGSPNNNQYAIAVISAGKDKKFDTTCNGYVDTTPADDLPDSPLLTKTAGSDDIVLGYSYAEANDLGNGLWKEKVADPTTLQTDKNVESTGGATFADKVVLTGNTATGGGLVLPSDPGNDSLSGPCDSAANDRQLRLNTSTTPPTLEICNWDGGAGLGWTPVSGGAGGGSSGPADCTGLGDAFINDPLTGHCYFHDSAGSDYPGTNALCTGIDPAAYLVSITGAAENTLVGAQGWDWSWIGGSDDASEGNWIYTSGELDGTQFWTGGLGGSAVGGQFSNWEAGEPSNAFGDSDCILTVNSGEWHVHGCTQIQPVICEKTGTPAAAPSGPADCTGLGDQSYNDPASGHCYFYESTNTFNQAAAQAACVAEGAYLAVPSSATENDLIYNTFPQDGPYLGLGDAAVDGEWRYLYGEEAGTQFWQGDGSTGSAVGGNYANWELPMDPGGGAGEACAVFNWNGANNWLSVDCVGYTSNYVCEKTGTGYGTSVPSPVSRWKLNETSGTTVSDSVGGRNGTFNNTPVWEPTGGANGGSLRTAQAGNHSATVPRAVALEPTAITLVAWVKPTSYPGSGWATIAQKSYQDNTVAPYASYALGTDAGYSNRVGWFNVYSTSAPPLNTWTHIVGTYDPNGSAPQSKIYINGVLDASATYTTPIVYDPTSPGGDFHIGRESTANAEIWRGSLDDIRVYNRVLTQAQIQDIYEATSPPAQSLTSPNRAGKLFGWGADQNNNFLGNGAGYLATSAPYAVINGDDFVQVASTSNTACAVKKDGTVWCWGDDQFGQLGNGGAWTNVHTMTQVPAITDAVKVSMMGSTACTLRKNGYIMCWGSNNSGQLGTGDTTASTVPIRATTISDFVDVAVGSGQTCGLRNNGTVMCWGEGSNGELGNGFSLDSLTPVPVSNITDFVSITAAHYYAAAAGHFCGVTKSGSAYCWGLEQNGEFGNGAPTGIQNTPQAVSTYTDWVMISSSGPITCGIRANGLAYCWGTEGAFGALGNGTTATAQLTPVPIDSSMTFTDVTVGYSWSVCAISTTRDLYCWGYNAGGINYVGSPAITASPLHSPVKTNGHNVIAQARGGGAGGFFVIMDEKATDAVVADKKSSIGSGNAFWCGIIKDGALVCAGDDTNGELGNGSITGAQTSPTGVTEPGPWMQVSVSPSNLFGHACAIKGDGTAWCWGEAGDGQLGNGGTTDQTSPVMVSGGATRKWSQIAAGGGYTCGLETDGDLYCWGYGIGSTPALLNFGKTWAKLGAGQNNICGIATDGELWCWGEDALGELGNGSATTTPQSNPVQVSSPGPWVDVAAGPISCGIKSNGSLWCWGDLATANITGWDNTVPQLMMDIGPWVKVKSNRQSVCAIKANGSLWCFGEGGLYMLGQGATTDYTYPVLVKGGGQYIDLSVGYDFACGMRSDDTVYCWGGAAQLPARAELTPVRAPWAWNTAENALLAAPGLSSIIGTSRWISDDGAATKGFNFAGSGRSQIRQTATANQLLIDTKGLSLDAQATLRAPSAVVASDVTDGLVRHFRLNDTAGSSMVDAIGVGNGTWNDSSGNSVAQETVPGINGTALRFDGINDKIDVPDHASLDTGAQITLSAWVKPMAAYSGGWNSIVQRESGTNGYDAYGLIIADPNSTGQGFFYFSTETDGIDSAIPVDNISVDNYLNQWVHVVGTYSDGSASLYINGQLVSQVVKTGALVDHSSPIFIGAALSSGLPGSYFNGMIDDVRIYNRALDPGEVSQLYYYTSQYAVTRSMGADSSTGNFKITRNNSAGDAWLSTLPNDLEINTSGNVGIGTSGHPASKLDVNGAIKVGNEATCNGAAEGTIRWTGTAMEYCDGTWQALTSNASGGGGGGLGNVGSWTSNTKTLGFLKSDGTAWTFGFPDNGRLGNNQDTVPAYINQTVQVHSDASNTGWTDWISVSSAWTSCGLRVDGSAWCWGYNTEGQCGGGGTSNNIFRPTIVRNTADNGEWYDWVHILTGDFASCGIRATGTAYCWGNNNDAALGNGVSGGGDYATTPQPVHSSTNPYTPWTDWKYVENEGRTSVGIRTNGEAYAWGLDVYGLGNLPSGQGAQTRPLVIKSTGGGAAWTDWKDISAGTVNICGIRGNGEMYCFGNGSGAQLGDGGWGYEDYPIRTLDTDCSSSSTNWVDVDISGGHGCAIKAGGTLWCWGRGAEGQAGNNDDGAGGGDGNNGNNYCMHQVLSDTGGAGWSDWVSVTADFNFTCGLRANGTAWCWGEGASTTGANAPLPVQVE